MSASTNTPQQPAASSQSSHQPSLGPFFETMRAFQRTEALKTALELEIFTAIGEGKTTADAIAARSNASLRGIRTLCDFMVTIGFLAKSGNNYALTPDSALFLDRRSPAYAGGAVRFLASPMLTEPYKRLTEAVRKGGTTAGAGTVAPEHPIWVDFAHAMAPMAAMPAEMLVNLVATGMPSKPRVLDIAAGHGLFGIAFAKRFPGASVTAVDWANVLEAGKENAFRAGVQDRYRTIAGSAFEVDLGGVYDIVLITNFLHHFGVSANERFLHRIHAAMAPGGRAITLEFIPNEDRVTPAQAAQFSMEMLAGTPEGDAYTFSELQTMFSNAGFSSTTMHELPPTFFRALVSNR